MTRRQLIPLLAAIPSTLRAAATAAAPVHIRRVTAWTAAAELKGLVAKAEAKDVRIVRIKSPQDGLILLVVLDVTGDLTLIDAARAAMAAEIAKLPAAVWLGVLRAQDGLRVLVDPTVDRESVTSSIQQSPVTGRAGLLETIEPVEYLATRLIHKAPVRTAILYVSDSNIYNYREDYTNPVINMSDSRDLSRRFPEALIREKTAKLTATLAGTDAPVFITHLAFLRDRLNDAYQTGLQQMAEATGGQAMFCRTQADIAITITQAFEKIRSMWAVDVEIPQGTPRNFTMHLSADGADLQYRTRFSMRAGGKE
ncbi:hypothetical protein [uncultured Paludibaculum sp.]|uniref:hypothetical protein n=1 Tax=uncultured Paludibaculum sp. TaxID=1765020 RepID=UPI002AAAB73F|nr:hypothetical protein [uncultured Paludibaculum sp.]